jgi:hypothetical protein
MTSSTRRQHKQPDRLEFDFRPDSSFGVRYSSVQPKPVVDIGVSEFNSNITFEIEEIDDSVENEDYYWSVDTEDNSELPLFPSIQIDIHGPMVLNGIKTYFALPRLEFTDSKQPFPHINHSLLAGNSLPIKVKFSIETDTHKKIKYEVGFVFSLKYNEEGYIVCYYSKTGLNLVRMRGNDLTIIPTSANDSGKIRLMEGKLFSHNLFPDYFKDRKDSI